MNKHSFQIIGVTGGMGSGKSYICKKLKELGYPIYEADAAAKEVMKLPNIIQQIQNEFGEESYINGFLNTHYLSKVFSDKKKLQKLNAIVHPAVATHFENYLFNLSTSKSLVFKEAAILFESGTWKSCDKIVTIFAPFGIRVNRILYRDPHLSLEQIYHRINQQWSDEWKVKNSHFTIFNDGFLNIDKQIQNLLKLIS
jgi:dephospho-CoA kinase